MKMNENEKLPLLLSLLRENAAEGRLPMHMPGHKRNPGKAPFLSSLSLLEDITEIDGFDNLHGAEGILRSAMDKAAALWGAERSFFLVNGSSGGILAGIRSLTKRGDTVLMTRAAHKSVYHAVELCGLHPVYLMPPTDGETGLFGSVSPDSVKKALAEHPEVRLVILTSPTYEGVISDIVSIAAVAHGAGVPLLVDEAHGAHLSLSTYFGGGAVRAGADVVVQSVHKTLPSLTQTAVLHAGGAFVDMDRLSHQLSVFETSSPSYLLMASIDGCVQTLWANPSLFAEWSEALDSFDGAIAGLRYLRIPYHGGTGLTDAFAYDRSKIYISVRGTSVTGPELTAVLRKRGIEPEMTSPLGVLAMTGMGDTKESLAALAKALCEIDAGCEARTPPPLPELGGNLPNIRLSPEAALEASFEWVEADKAAGRIAAEYVWAYPPGIPVLVPGEEISGAFLCRMAEDKQSEWHSTRGRMPGYIAVLR